MNSWLIIVAAVAVLWVLWLFMNFVGDLLQAALRREDSSSDKERGSSL